MTLSHRRSLDTRTNVGDHIQLLLDDAIARGKVLRIIGDNLNFYQRHKYETMKSKNHKVHMFSSAVLANPNSFCDLNTERPSNEGFGIENVIFNNADFSICMPGWVKVVGEILDDFFPQLNLRRSVAHINLLTEDAAARASPTEVINLPIKNLNEAILKEVVQIMDYYAELAQTIVKKSDVQDTVQVGGDQMTAKAEREAKKLRKGNADAVSSFSQLHPITFEFFHLYMNYLDKVYGCLWRTGKPGKLDPTVSPGTMQSLAEIISRELNPRDTKNNYEKNKCFFESVFRVYLATAFMDFVGMDDTTSNPTKYPLPVPAAKAMSTWTQETLSAFITEVIYPVWSKNAHTATSISRGMIWVLYCVRPVARKKYVGADQLRYRLVCDVIVFKIC